jgi:phosphate transport system substrate-binding protein
MIPRVLFFVGALWVGLMANAQANVEAVGTPLVAQTIRQWQSAFTAAQGIRASYTNSLEDISTAELYVGIYDLAVVEFPSSDYRLEQLGLIQFPLFSYGVAVVANVPGVASEDLKLNGQVLADIYMGKVTHWDHPAIAALNPGQHLPRLAIIPVAQSDGSVTTLNFTRYLAAESPEWLQRVGIGSGLIWPLGKWEKDARSAAQKLLDTAGAIGFQSGMVVNASKLNSVKLQNKQGQFVSMTSDRVQATIDRFLNDPQRKHWAPVNLSGGDDWPINAIVYGQIKRVPEDIPDAMEMVQFLTWSLTNMNNVQVQPGLYPVPFKSIESSLNLMETKKTYDGRPVRSRK